MTAQNQFVIQRKRIRGLSTSWIHRSPQNSFECPILFGIHGFPDSAHSWDGFIQHWVRESTEEFEVVLPFLRGTGKSAPSKDLSRYGLDSTVMDYLEILQSIDQKAKRKVFIVAHDIGGAIAFELGKKLKSQLSGIILINAPHLDLLVRLQIQKRHHQWLKSFYIPLFLIPKLSEMLFQRIGPTVLGKEKMNFIGSASQSQLIKYYRAFCLDLASRIKNKRLFKDSISQPVLFIFSSNDPYLEIPSHGIEKQECPNSTLRVLQGKHWIHQDAKQLKHLVRICRLFFTEVSQNVRPTQKKYHSSSHAHEVDAS